MIKEKYCTFNIDKDKFLKILKIQLLLKYKILIKHYLEILDM